MKTVLLIMRNKDSYIEIKTEQQAMLEILLENWKDHRMQVARIKQTIVKVIVEDKFL